MSTDITKIIGGPAKIQFGGATFYSQADITHNVTLETFPIATDRFQQVDERALQTTSLLRFTPIGVFEALSVLFSQYAAAPLGDLITPVRTFGDVSTDDDQVTITGHKLRDGMAVQLSTTTTLPAGLAVSTLYYLHTVDDDTVSFHTTYANAIAGTSAVAITDTGTGTHKLIQQEPLIIHTVHGKKFTFHNAAITQIPQLLPGATRTILGEVIFEAFRKNDTDPEDDNSLYTEEDVAYTDDEFDPADIITQCYGAAWGSAPWDDFATKTGFTVDFGLTLEPVETDCGGVLTRRLVGMTVSAKAQPIGISESDLLTALKLQGTGAERGRSLAGEDLNITGTGVYIRLTAAALVGGPMTYSSRNDRIGELEWRATRTFTSGVANPLFFVGTADPDA
jgi:hypothetical protein